MATYHMLRIDAHPNMVNLPMYHGHWGWGDLQKAAKLENMHEVMRIVRLVKAPEQGGEVRFTVLDVQEHQIDAI